LRTSFRSLAVELTTCDTNSSGAQPMEVDTTVAKVSEPAPDAASDAFQERILASICDDYIYHSRTEASSHLPPLADHARIHARSPESELSSTRPLGREGHVFKNATPLGGCKS
jgi:hypothetical protein